MADEFEVAVEDIAAELEIWKSNMTELMVDVVAAKGIGEEVVLDIEEATEMDTVEVFAAFVPDTAATVANSIEVEVYIAVVEAVEVVDIEVMVVEIVVFAAEAVEVDYYNLTDSF